MRLHLLPTAGRRALLALAAACALSACGGEVHVMAPGGGTSGGGLSGGGLSGGGGTATVQGPLGRWKRTLVFSDGYGGYATSETTWDFARDSIATRINVVRNTSWGAAEVYVSTARWHVEGTTMVVDFVTPETGTARFRWRVERFVDGDVLWLDDTPFVRAYP